MTYFCSFHNPGPLESFKIKKNLKKILEESGFKKKFCLGPFTRKYIAPGEVSVKINSGTGFSAGCKEHGIGPYEYHFIGLKMDGPEDNELFQKTSRKLSDYWNKFYPLKD